MKLLRGLYSLQVEARYGVSMVGCHTMNNQWQHWNHRFGAAFTVPEMGESATRSTYLSVLCCPPDSNEERTATAPQDQPQPQAVRLRRWTMSFSTQRRFNIGIIIHVLPALQAGIVQY